MRFGIICNVSGLLSASLTRSMVWVPVFISPAVKPRGREANSEIDNELMYTAYSPCTYLEWAGTELPYFSTHRIMLSAMLQN